MNECFFCGLTRKGNVGNLIAENHDAFATADGHFREGHCTVIVKKHIESVSQMTEDQFHSVFSLITTVSKALEKKYVCEKTYLLSIGDQVSHLHFHLIPKHRDKCSMGRYCFAALFESEGRRNPSDSERSLLAKEVRDLIGEVITGCDEAEVPE